jgi:hypothetical protein
MAKGSTISDTEARAMTLAYRTAHSTYPVSATFDKSLVQAILDGTDCEYFRVYFGMREKNKEENELTAILIGCNTYEQDIIANGIVEVGDHTNNNPL